MVEILEVPRGCGMGSDLPCRCATFKDFVAGIVETGIYFIAFVTLIIFNRRIKQPYSFYVVIFFSMVAFSVHCWDEAS